MISSCLVVREKLFFSQCVKMVLLVYMLKNAFTCNICALLEFYVA